MSAFEVKVTGDQLEVRAAQRLRFEVFNLEMHEGLNDSYERGLDADDYDPLCDHIIVRTRGDGRVVGTYRLLLGSRAKRHFGFYSEREFNLERIKKLEGEILELGRSCVHRDFRDKVVIDTMWQAIAEYVRRHEVRYLFGCASLHTADPAEVSKFFSLLKQKYYAPDAFRVDPLPEKAFPGLKENVEATDPKKLFSELPSLIKGYLRVGAVLCGPAAIDREFGTTDFFLLLDLSRLSRLYRRRFGFTSPQVRGADR